MTAFDYLYEDIFGFVDILAGRHSDFRVNINIKVKARIRVVVKVSLQHWLGFIHVVVSLVKVRLNLK